MVDGSRAIFNEGQHLGLVKVDQVSTSVETSCTKYRLHLPLTIIGQIVHGTAHEKLGVEVDSEQCKAIAIGIAAA